MNFINLTYCNWIIMKKIGFVIQFLCIALFLFGQADKNGIRFIEGEKWENVLKAAQEQDKYIFMDCYTSWCGPCKALAKDIFTRKDVGDFFNANFINVKYDMEKGEGKELNKRYKANIIGFPTLLLIDKKGKVVHQMAGFQEADCRNESRERREKPVRLPGQVYSRRAGLCLPERICHSFTRGLFKK